MPSATRRSHDDGKPVEAVCAKIGSLYIRKTAFEPGAEPPKRLTVASATEGERFGVVIECIEIAD